MKTAHATGLLALILAAPSYAKDRVFEPVAQAGQSIEYEDGSAVLIVQDVRAALYVSFLPRDKKTALIKIAISNIGDRPFTISERSFSASSSGEPLTVMTYEDRLREQKRKDTWSAIAAGLNAASNNISASNAGYQNSYGTYNATTNAHVYGNGRSVYGTAYTSGTYSGTSYNAAAAQQAQMQANQQNQTNFDRQRAEAAFAQQDLQSRALKANSLSPGEFIIGDVQISLPKRNKKSPAQLQVIADIDGRSVPFTFRERE